MEGRDDGATACSEKDSSGGPVLQFLRAEAQRRHDAWSAGDGEGGELTFAAPLTDVQFRIETRCLSINLLTGSLC